METPAEVHVWHAALDAPDVPRSPWIAPDEQARAERMRFERDRARFVAAHGFLRALLAGYLDCVPDAIELERDSAGKPRVAAPADRLRFNLSHSGGFALAAVADDREVGADVELVRPLYGGNGLARRVLSPGEFAELERLPQAARVSALFAAWTRKEAVLKACGEGLRRSPASVEAGVSARESPQTIQLAPAGSTWSVASVTVGADCAAAVAVAGTGLRVTLRAWSWAAPPSAAKWPELTLG